jgi:hypothetical protein
MWADVLYIREKRGTCQWPFGIKVCGTWPVATSDEDPARIGNHIGETK